MKLRSFSLSTLLATAFVIAAVPVDAQHKPTVAQLRRTIVSLQRRIRSLEVENANLQKPNTRARAPADSCGPAALGAESASARENGKLLLDFMPPLWIDGFDDGFTTGFDWGLEEGIATAPAQRKELIQAQSALAGPKPSASPFLASP